MGYGRKTVSYTHLFAGIAQAEGDCIAVMDCDLQHPPETLIKMYRLWEDGYQVIEGVLSLIHI